MLCVLMISSVLIGFVSASSSITLPTTPVTAVFTDGVNSYFDTQLKNVPAGYTVTNRVYLGWCIDRKHTMDRNTDLLVLLYSMDNLPPILEDHAWNLTMVTYILNHKQGTMEDIQDAIWYFITFVSGGYEPPGGYSAASLAMINDALTNGEGFVPGPYDVNIVILVPLRAREQLSIIEIQNPGTGTPGYWKNHPEAWPVEQITIGGVTYTKTEAINLMETSVKGDKTYTMFNALVAAKLNVMIGNDACITSVINDADAWMQTYGPVGSGVPANSDAWQSTGEQLYEQLDDYNNGLLCAPPRM